MRRFFMIAALAWATINSLEYYWFGRALTAADTWVQVALVGTLHDLAANVGPDTRLSRNLRRS